ncbi:unnamed protein product [Sympodiomycopsis kandeliae]
MPTKPLPFSNLGIIKRQLLQLLSIDWDNTTVAQYEAGILTQWSTEGSVKSLQNQEAESWVAALGQRE